MVLLAALAIAFHQRPAPTGDAYPIYVLAKVPTRNLKSLSRLLAAHHIPIHSSPAGKGFQIVTVYQNKYVAPARKLILQDAKAHGYYKIATKHLTPNDFTPGPALAAH